MPLIDSIGMSRPLGMCSVLVDLVASRLGDDKERKNTQQVKDIGSMSTNMRAAIPEWQGWIDGIDGSA